MKDNGQVSKGPIRGQGPGQDQGQDQAQGQGQDQGQGQGQGQGQDSGKGPGQGQAGDRGNRQDPGQDRYGGNEQDRGHHRDKDLTPTNPVQEQTGAEPDSEEQPRAQSQELRNRFVYQDDDVMEKAFNWKQMLRLFKYMKPYTRLLIPVICVMVVLGTITKLSIPMLVEKAVDGAINEATAVTDNRVSMIAWIAAIMLVMYVVQWAANTYRIRLTNVIGQRVIHDLRNDLFRHIQQLSFRFFDKRPAGSVLVRVTNDVNSLQELFTNGVINMLVDCVQLIGIIVILLMINFKLGLAVMVTVPIMFFISSTLRKRIRRAWQDVRVKQSRINAHLNESIQGIRVTQAFTQEKENMGYFNSMNMENRRNWDRASALNHTFGPLIEITAALGTCILFWYGSHLIQSQELTIGVFLAFSIYIGNFWEPINRLGNMYAQLLIAMASSERIFEFLDEKPSVGETARAAELPPVRGKVEFRDVVFEYEAGRPALRGISLSAEPGQSIALVGHTGSGKSTIINLLCRFYDVTEGQVLIDSMDIRNVTLQSLRSQVGIVMQDTFIFSGTIRDNIRFGRLDATDEEVEQAARAVHAHDFIVKLPYGYDTEVEERGNVLSMGQRQLISFARTLLANPAVLILDEATASIDTETEMKIQQALGTLLKGRTSFMIAHRLSTIRHADQIVVLDHGLIKEQGTHDELMQRRGIYWGLIDAQYKFLNETG